MGKILHESAHTTEAIRPTIQHSPASLTPDLWRPAFGARRPGLDRRRLATR